MASSPNDEIWWTDLLFKLSDGLRTREQRSVTVAEIAAIISLINNYWALRRDFERMNANYTLMHNEIVKLRGQSG